MADRSSGAYLAYLVISGGALSNKKIGSQTKGEGVSPPILSVGQREKERERERDNLQKMHPLQTPLG